MISILEKPSEGSTGEASTQATTASNETAMDETPSMPVVEPNAPPTVAGASDEVVATTKIPILDGLTRDERRSLLKACVALVGVPVDADALNAVLRLCLRLTQVSARPFGRALKLKKRKFLCTVKILINSIGL